jgi:putative restriction endonuclease
VDESGDLKVRLAAFEWLREQVDAHGDVLPRDLLVKGFSLEGQRVPLIGPQGIFKPRLCDLPLSITTSPNSPYRDSVRDRLIAYSYRGHSASDIAHPDNVGLRAAMTRRIPLVYFYGVVPGRYIANWPAYVVHDDPAELTFTVAIDESSRLSELVDLSRIGEERDEIRREYVTAVVRHRLHQRAFRERVLRAYEEQCALCRLRHQELLDAAHIVADAEDEGDPVISNGLALCKLHHAAFDSFFLTVRPDYVIEVRSSILEESDGPMLLVGLKQIDGQRIQLPRARVDRPDPGRLERRYERFRQAS